MSNQACRVLELTLPYLYIKHSEAELGIAFQKEKRGRHCIWHASAAIREMYFGREACVQAVLKKSRQSDNPNLGKQIKSLLQRGQIPLTM